MYMEKKPYLKMLHERWDRQRAEANKILSKYSINEPICGFEVGMGWMPVVEEALKEMIDIGWDKNLSQVKQKFCGLRIYVGGNWNDGIKKIIDEAEEKCSKICEDCGIPHGLKIPKSGRALCMTCEKVWEDA